MGGGWCALNGEFGCRTPGSLERIIRSITHAPDQTLTRPQFPPLFIRSHSSEPVQS
jgi:hypothetical protein